MEMIWFFCWGSFIFWKLRWRGNIGWGRGVVVWLLCWRCWCIIWGGGLGLVGVWGNWWLELRSGWLGLMMGIVGIDVFFLI